MANAKSGEILCLVISLSRSSERRAAITARLNDLGLGFEFVDAIDAAEGFSPQLEALIDRRHFFAKHGRSLSDVEAACALSHTKAYQRFLSSDQHYALILEDDAEPEPALAAFLAAGAHRLAPFISFYHSKARIFRGAGVEAIPGVRLHKLGMSPFGAVAYVLNRQAAAQLLKAATPISDLADWPMDLSELGACITLPIIVGHPPVHRANQSLLDLDRKMSKAQRSGKLRRTVKKLLNLSYWRRKQRKVLCRKVS